MCLPNDQITLSPSLFADQTVGLPTGPFAIESYQKLANGTYGEGLFYLCNYTGALKPLLDQHLEVKNVDGALCYCGYVEEVYRCCGEYVAWGWSNAALFNRIAVTWLENGVTQLTPYQEDRASIAAYGLRELVLPLPSGALYTPAQYAQRLLKELSQPLPVLHNTYKCNCNITYLRTQGYVNTLAWQSYRHPCGLADTGATFAHGQPLGVGFTATQLAINGGTNGESQIGLIGDQLLAFAPGDLLLMSGWHNAQNNLVTTLTDFVKDDFESVTSDGITTVGNNINDANNSLLEFHPDELIQVSGAGTGDLDGYYWVRTEADGPAISVQHQSFPTANYLGIPITITQGVTINVPSNLAQEEPGATVTIQAWHQYLCQRICNDCTASGEPAEPWVATHVAVAVRKVGAPGAGLGLMVGAACTAARVMATATIGAAEVGARMGYVLAELDAPITLAPGQCVYVQVHSLAPLSTTAYYEIGGSLAQDNSLRTLTGPDGVSYTATAYTAAVRLLQYESITEQLFDLVGQGRFVTSVAVVDALTFPVPTYRAGYTSLLYAIEQLLTMGDPTGNRLQLSLACNGAATIRTEPAYGDEPGTILTCCGTLTDATGASLTNLCTATAGRWLCPEDNLTDVPGIFLESFYVNYKQCRLRFLDRTFSRTRFNQALRYPGII